MIEHFRNIQLVNTDNLQKSRNVFSILVGKNGTGKSTLLGELSQQLIKEINHRHDSNSLFFETNDTNRFPNEIIAVSTSPFDKFPLDRFSRIKRYTYLGLRDLVSSSFGIAYLSKIISSLIESVSKDIRQANEIGKVLNYLGYQDVIFMDFQFASLKSQIQEILNRKNLVKLFEDRNNILFKRLNKSFFLNKDDSINERKLHRLQEALRHLSEGGFTHNFQIILDNNGLNIHSNESDEILFLIHAGLLRLRDVQLQTLSDYQTFSIKNASSGEQSIILSILGIASKIKDNCLICIDEPEICLHPQWQEKYIEILSSTFDTFRNCQFIIATHSPLIISRLPNVNSFITDMETHSIKDADEFINHSADYQLANVFSYPGFKNEYLTRIAVNTFSKVAKSKSFDLDDELNFDILEKQSPFLKEDDPVYDLYKTLNELKDIYG